MYTIDEFRIKVTVELESGVYRLDTESGSGKTFLAGLFERYREYGARVRAYSYQNFLDGVLIWDVLDPEKYDVVILDRYDMYYGEGVQRMQEVQDRMVVLVDSKRPLKVASRQASIIRSRAEVKIL